MSRAMPFALELPFRDTSPSGAPETPRRVRACLKEIGQAEPAEACQRLTDLIGAQNQLALGPERRLRLLEIVRPAVRAPLDALAVRVQAQALPLPQRTREIAQLQRALLHALIVGYESVAGAANASHRGRAVAIVAERLLAARSELLVRHIEVQEPLPATFWQRTNAIYARAEAAGVARRRLTDKHWQGVRRPAPADAYVSLLLLALAHPRGLRPGEAARIHRATQDWCREAALTRATAAPADAATRGTVFAVALDAVTAPVQWRQRAGEPRAEERVLDLARVVGRVEKLHARTVAAGGAFSDDAIGPTGLKRLLDHWNPRPLRREPEGADGQPAEVLIGLAAIQQRLDGGGIGRASAKRAQGARQYTHLGENVLQTIAADDAPAAYPHARAAVERSDPAPGGHAQPPSDWFLEEIDASGFRLRWQGPGVARATVGELVSVRVAGATAAGPPRYDAGWQLGVVRWLQFVDDSHFAIGCELLSPRPRAGRLRPEPSDRHRRTSPRGTGEPALLLPGGEHPDDVATVLAPAHQFRAQEVLELDAGERTLRVQLTAVREQSIYFTLFELAPAPARGRTSGATEAARARSVAG